MGLFDRFRKPKYSYTPRPPAVGPFGHRERLFAGIEHELKEAWQGILDSNWDRELSSERAQLQAPLRESLELSPAELVEAESEDPWYLSPSDFPQFAWDFDKVGGWELDHVDIYEGNYPRELRDLELSIYRWAAARHGWPAIVREDVDGGRREYKENLAAYERPTWRELCQDPHMQDAARRALGGVDPQDWPAVLAKLYERRVELMMMELSTYSHDQDVRRARERPVLSDASATPAPAPSDPTLGF